MRQVFTFFLLISTLVIVFAQSDDVRKKNYNVKKKK